MRRPLVSLVIIFSFSKAYTQLLSWTPAFAKDDDNIVIAIDAAKGNQGLFNYAFPKGRQTISLFKSTNYLKTGTGYFIKIITTEGFGTVKFIAIK